MAESGTDACTVLQIEGRSRTIHEMKGEPVDELGDDKWLCDSAFTVDVTKHLSELNLQLQGPNQLVSALVSDVKSFEAKSKLWQMQLVKSDGLHFPTLQEQKPAGI